MSIFSNSTSSPIGSQLNNYPLGLNAGSVNVFKGALSVSNGLNAASSNASNAIPPLDKSIWRLFPEKFEPIEETIGTAGFDCIYPWFFPARSPQICFHMMTFIAAHFDSINDFLEIATPVSFENHILLNFKKEHDRNVLIEWWEKYTNRFTDFKSQFFPTLTAGKINGFYIDMGHHSFYSTVNYAGDFIPEWTWILKNCQSPVYHFQTGWLFTDETEAALFHLFDPKIHNSIWS